VKYCGKLYPGSLNMHIAAYRPQPKQLSLKIFRFSEDFKT